MRELQQARLVHVRFGGPAPAAPPLSGLKVREQQDGRATWEYAGELAPLLEWLATHPVLDLRVEPLGLSGIYHRYHGVEA